MRNNFPNHLRAQISFLMKKKRKRKTNQIYESLTEIFLTFINEHVLLKKNLVRGNQTHFITKELQKKIYIGTR